MEEHSKEFLEKLKGLLAFAKEHKNALEHQEIVDYFKGISLTETQSEKILDYLDGACTLEDAIYKIKRDTRHFAKRQITWFKREKHVTWINKKDYNYDEDKILEVMLESIKKDILEEQSWLRSD